jgi:hypothetical protein
VSTLACLAKPFAIGLSGVRISLRLKPFLRFRTQVNEKSRQIPTKCGTDKRIGQSLQEDDGTRKGG